MSESSAATAVLLQEVETDSGHRIGLALLNAERALNALTLDMIRLLTMQLARWAEDERVSCVMLQGAGEKAFCAGGDVRFLRDAILARSGPTVSNRRTEQFFSEEYRLDFSIHTYPKPILVWGSGIVMGGGVGLFAGASHRVVTETSRLAMPEMSIGLFPDVGANWFLQRMPHRIGLFLALTGASLNGADARYLGIADWFLRSTDRHPVLKRLTEMPWTSSSADNHARLSNELAAFAGDARPLEPPSVVRVHADEIAQLTLGESLSQVMENITSHVSEDRWMNKAVDALTRGSPTSAALIWELWHRSKHLSLADVFRLELIVALQCCEHPDFAEGVRAALIDKDNKPKWTPPTVAEVTPDWIQQHFVPTWQSSEASPLADLSSQRRGGISNPQEVTMS